MAEQGKLQPHRVGAYGLAPIPNAVQAGITEISDQLRRQRRERVLTQVLDQRVGLVAFTLLGAGLLGGGNVGQVALEGGFERHALRGTALDIDATHHFIFGAAAPVLSVTFGTKGLGGSGPAGLANDGFPATRGGLDDGGHENLQGTEESVLYRNCTLGLWDSPEGIRKMLILLVGPAGLEPATKGL